MTGVAKNPDGRRQVGRTAKRPLGSGAARSLIDLERAWLRALTGLHGPLDLGRLRIQARWEVERPVAVGVWKVRLTAAAQIPKPGSSRP
jgi:hypothetical protein